MKEKYFGWETLSVIRIKILVEGRIIKQLPRYKKVHEGCMVAKEIGLDKIRQECHHFDAWITRLLNLRPL